MAPLVALYVVVVACALLGLHAIAYEVDRSDGRRAGEAVTAAFNYHQGRLESVTLNNAVYTEAWKAVGGPVVDKAWAYENWTVAPPGLPGHHGILLLDADNRPILGTRAGKPMGEAEIAEMAALVGPTIARLRPEVTASVRGLITTGPTPLWVAAANVVPEPADQSPAMMAGPKKRLALIHPIDPAMLDTMNETVGSDHLGIATAPTETSSVSFTADKGRPLILEWGSPQPGQAAKLRLMKVIVPVLLLVTVLMIAAMRAGLATTRALNRAAHVDQLTGIANRAAFTAFVNRSLARGKPIILGLLDLDGFKQVNDSFGHTTGDDLLVRFSQLLSEVATADDFIARLGGDEFAFVCDSQAAADRFVTSLQETLAVPHVVSGHAVRIRTSVGTAAAEKGWTSRELLTAADIALYTDKKARKAALSATTITPSRPDAVFRSPRRERRPQTA